ncbi:hypothetical protein DM02DRAFT_717422 [Periconia macrospinosa]|uniref:TPR-like protein n=1 Tax=Periconia macrospinosa TaxID=97972 RepID=A0A2V1DW35_9PLEO|nr:hypothetical protein DM02DRAFT_717422 [Periconia macrospinosa]
MPPKHKDLLFKPKPKGKINKAQDPQSENDFLEAADEHEQAAGKWRAGDAAKATRFFNRAIEVYNEGLKRFPRSFDLAYNKANLEYNLTQDMRILPHLGPKIALLEETLESHRAAMQLAPPTNTDILFNTAQVLTSLAEAALEAETQQFSKVPARTLLEEATDLFAQCLLSQEKEYEKVEAEIAQAMKAQQESGQDIHAQSSASAHEDEGNMETESTGSSGPDEWATVEEPLTPETILETCTAHLGALTALLPLYDPADTQAIQSKTHQGEYTANKAIPVFIERVQTSPFKKEHDDKSTAGPTLSLSSTPASEEFETSPKDDALLAAATFQAASIEFQYRAAQLSATQYATTIEAIFSTLTSKPESPSQQDQSAYLNAVSAYADALIDLASAISDISPSVPTDAEIQWTSLTHAQKLLTSLTTSNPPILPASRLADIFLARGDIELFRFHLSFTPVGAAKSAWVNSRAVLVANAGVYYRGARAYGDKAVAAGTGDANVRDMADGKAVVAEVLKEVHATRAGAEGGAGGVVIVKDGWKGKGAKVKRALEQLVEEGVLGRDEAEGVVGILGEA